ncbi:MAG: DUF4212 domain-containing protein [Rhodocyclaceae bacterium]|jgi:putative solute:sodium symporter small subunit|nr:DUF4212 domain-containing protein [Rhodocyclaceae bacterium]
MAHEVPPATEAPPRPLSPRQRAYWRATLWLTGVLLLIWFASTFLVVLFATELNAFTFMGFPLAYYFFSQGALVVFLLLIGAYVWIMNRLDQYYEVGERRRHRKARRKQSR